MFHDRRTSFLAGVASGAIAGLGKFEPLETKDSNGGSTDIVKVAEAIDKVGRNFEEFKSSMDEQLKLVKKGQSDPVLEEKLKNLSAEILKGVAEKDKLQGLADEHGATVKRVDELEASLKRVRLTETINKDELKEADLFARSRAMLQGFKFDPEQHVDVKAYESYQRAFGQYLRKGGDDPRQGAVLSQDEIKALSAGVLADGGYLLAPAQSNRILSTIRETSPLRALATVETIGTDTLEFLVDSDEAGMGWVGETASRPETGTPQLAKRSITTGEQYANPAITQKLLDDATMNVEAWLANKVADKFGRTEATAFVRGDGVNKPRGFLDYAAGTGANQVPHFDFGTAEGGIDPDALIGMAFALKDPFAARATWLANRFIVPALMRLKDNNGQYIWQPGLQQGAPATLLGRPLRFAADMDAPGAGARSLAIADWGAAYTIVDRIGIRTLRDPYTNKPYIHFYSTRRVGGAVVDFEALLVGRQAAPTP